MVCERGSKDTYGLLNWTVAENTPPLVYYQSYTYEVGRVQQENRRNRRTAGVRAGVGPRVGVRAGVGPRVGSGASYLLCLQGLGWKINVLDAGESSCSPLHLLLPVVLLCLLASYSY